MSQEIILIAAVGANRAIGKDNRLLWSLPEDMKRFKALTLGHAVLMGRKTWESLPPKFRPLPGRKNIVVTRNTYYALPGAKVEHTLEDGIKAAGKGKVFIIGGAEVYDQAMLLADRLELTEVHDSPEGDAFFPIVDPTQWRETARESQPPRDGGPGYDFVRYERL